MSPRQQVAARMLMAVNRLVTDLETNPDSTTEFWDAFKDFGPIFIHGNIDIQSQETTGDVLVKFRP